MHVNRGLRQALILLFFSVVVALVAAGLWLVLQDGGFRVSFAGALIIIAGLLSLTGGTMLSRDDTSNEVRAFLGEGPDREEPYTGEALTGLGIFFVRVAAAVRRW